MHKFTSLVISIYICTRNEEIAASRHDRRHALALERMAEEFSYATCTPDEAKLYREVRQLMAEAPADQPELSSDEEDYTNRLMSGRTNRRSFGSSPSARHAPPVDPLVRRDSVPASGTSQFHGRIAFIFDALGTGGSSGTPGTAGSMQQDPSGRIGPAFSNQCEGHALEEPKEAAPLDDDSAEEAGDDDDGGDDDDDDGYGDLPGETKVNGAEEDPREWSRHTASWAQELGSSDEDEDEASGAAAMRACRPAPPSPAAEGFGGAADLSALDDEDDTG